MRHVFRRAAGADQTSKSKAEVEIPERTASKLDVKVEK